MLRDRSYVCAGATEAPQRGRGEFRQDFNWAAGRSKPHPEPAAAAERGSGGRYAPYIWYGCQTYLPHNFCPVPDCLTILRADHARKRDHRDRLPRPGHPEWTTYAAALEAEGNSLRENRRLSRPQFDAAGRFAKVRGSSFAPMSQLGSCVANALVFELAGQHPGSLCRSGRWVEECATQVQPRRLHRRRHLGAKDRAGKDERCTAVFR